MHSWPGLLSRQIDLAERDSLTAQVAALTQPAPTNWVLARVAALLTAYYAADVPSQIVSIEAHVVREKDKFECSFGLEPRLVQAGRPRSQVAASIDLARMQALYSDSAAALQELENARTARDAAQRVRAQIGRLSQDQGLTGRADNWHADALSTDRRAIVP